MKKSLIVYYSFSGSTAQMAEAIAAHTQGDLRPLIPQKPYSFSHNTASKDVRSEITRMVCPALASGNESIDDYDTIYIGSPNWFKSIAPPVRTFLHAHNFSSKTVLPFCTHGGGGFGLVESVMQELCTGATVLPGLEGTETDVDAIRRWIDGVSS